MCSDVKADTTRSIYRADARQYRGSRAASRAIGTLTDRARRRRIARLHDSAMPPTAHADAPAPQRPIQLRARDAFPAQQRALDTLWPAYGLPFAPATLDFDRVFGRRAPRVLDVGFGMGETTAAMALARPDNDFVAIDVHAPGVGRLLNRIDEGRLSNVRVMKHDAVERCLGCSRACFSGGHVFLPRPWRRTAITTRC